MNKATQRVFNIMISVISTDPEYFNNINCITDIMYLYDYNYKSDHQATIDLADYGRNEAVEVVNKYQDDNFDERYATTDNISAFMTLLAYKISADIAIKVVKPVILSDVSDAEFISAIENKYTEVYKG